MSMAVVLMVEAKASMAVISKLMVEAKALAAAKVSMAMLMVEAKVVAAAKASTAMLKAEAKATAPTAASLAGMDHGGWFEAVSCTASFLMEAKVAAKVENSISTGRDKSHSLKGANSTCQTSCGRICDMSFRTTRTNGCL